MLYQPIAAAGHSTHPRFVGGNRRAAADPPHPQPRGVAARFRGARAIAQLPPIEGAQKPAACAVGRNCSDSPEKFSCCPKSAPIKRCLFPGQTSPGSGLGPAHRRPRPAVVRRQCRPPPRSAAARAVAAPRPRTDPREESCGAKRSAFLDERVADEPHSKSAAESPQTGQYADHTLEKEISV